MAHILRPPRRRFAAPPVALAALAAVCLLAAPRARAGIPAASPTPLSPARAVAVMPLTLHISPDVTSASVGQVQPGQEVAILRLAHGYAQVFAGRSGWMLNRGLVLLNNPQAAEILFGAADDLEQRAEQFSGERRAAKGAARLYYQVYDEFPHSFRAAEALYRAAEITWQLDTAGGMTPSSGFSDYDRPSNRLLRKVVSKFPKTQWAARAEYLHLREKLTCSDWAVKPSCIGKEIGKMRSYWHHYPKSPLAAEVAYGIVYREAAAVAIYNHSGPHRNPGKARDYRRNAYNSIADLQRRWPRSTWAARAALLYYDLQQGIPVGRHQEASAASAP